MQFFKNLKEKLVPWFQQAQMVKQHKMIHPEIEKFWKKCDCILVPVNYDKNSSYYMVFAYRPSTSEQVKIYLKLGNEETYYLNGNRYSEKEILKVIKLKAFL